MNILSQLFPNINNHLLSFRKHSCYTFSKDVVDCIAFCTKNPQKIIPYLKMIDELGYKYYFT